MAKVCNIGIKRVVNDLTKDKPWYKYEEDGDFIQVLTSPKQKINERNVKGVAITTANSLNKSINKQLPIGKVFKAITQFDGRVGILISPTDKQLELLNSKDAAEREELIKEVEQEELQKEEARLRDLQEKEKERGAYTEEQRGEFFQLEGTESSTASPKTIAAIKDFLKRIGVDIKSMDAIVVGGIKQDADGVALLAQKLVQVIEGKEATALTEEAMHFAVEIIQQKNPKLFNRMLKEINDSQTYKEVLATYSTNPLYQTKDGKPDILKLKKEAIAKAIAESVIDQNEQRSESNSVVAKIQQWWLDMVQTIKNLIAGANIDQAALDIISGKAIGTAEDIKAEENEAYLQQNKSKRDIIYDRIKDMMNKIEKRGEEGYFVNGKKIGRRVSDESKDWYSRMFADKKLTDSEFTTAVNTLKAEKGTAGHKDIEHAFDLFIDEDGFLRSDDEIDEAIKNDDGYVSLINSSDRSMYEMLRDNLRARLASFPEGTRFMAEATVYDAKRDIGGTADFIAIDPEGKVSILDWKFIDLNLEKTNDIPWFKVRGWRIQMEQYKQIISQVYGVNSQDFEQTRMIPIRAIYTEGNAKLNIKPKLSGIEIGGIDVNDIQEDYLLPLSLETEKTGSEEIDSLLEKLNAIYKKISEKKVLPGDKGEKSEQLNKLFYAIRQLQMKRNVLPLIEQSKLLNQQIRGILDTYKTKYEGKDPKSFTQDEINAFTKTISDGIDSLNTYTQLDTELGFLFEGEELSEKDKALKALLAETSYNAGVLERSLIKIDKQFTDKIIAGSEGIEGAAKGEKIIKGLQKLFGNTATIQLKGLQVLFKKANRAFAFAGMDTLTESRTLLKLKEAYQKWANAKGLTIKNMFDIIKKKDSNELIDQYNPEFYSELKKRIQDKDYKWIRENVDVTLLKEQLEEKKREEFERIQNKLDTGKLSEIEAKIERVKTSDLYNIGTPESIGWLVYDEVKKFPIEKWESKEWKELTAKGNEAAKDFYDYIQNRNQYYQSIGYINARQARTFLPWVRKGLAEKLIFGGKVTLGEQFLRNISMDEGDVGFGKRDPLSGKLVDSIPTYFTQEIEGDVSTDLFKTMALYNEMAIKFKYLTDIEEQGRALIRLEQNKKAISTSWFGKTEYDKKSGQLQYNPDNSENTKIIEDMVKAIIYQQRFIQSETFDQVLGKFGKFGEKINKKLGFKMLPENLEGRQVSINKVISNINRTFQLNALGLNVLSSMSNLFGGSAQSWINAGTYFTKSEFVSTEMWILGQKMNGLDGLDKQKAIAALDYFLPLTENYGREITKKLSVSKLNQESVQDFLMVLMRNSDKAVQTANFYAYLRNSIVENGEIVNAREFLRNSPEYADRYEGNNEERKAKAEKFEEDVKKLIEEKSVIKLGSVVDGEFVIPGIERKSESVVALRRKVQQLSSDALGSMSEENKRLINLSIYGNSFMIFKNWIPRLVDVRMGNLKYNSASDAYEWGRTRMLYRVITTDFVKSIDSFKSAIMGNNDKWIAQVKELYEQKKADYENDTGKELEMTEAEFIDLVSKNIKNQMYDMLVYAGLLSLLLGLKANAPDDGEDPIVKNQYKFLLKATDKFADEIGYFYDPTSLTKLVSTGIFPSIGLIDNYKKVLWNFMKENYALGVGDEELAEKTYVIKYAMRSVPSLSQLSSILPMFYPDLAKDLGIKMQSQSGIR